MLGDAEAAEKTVNFKWLKTGEQEAISQSDLLAKTEEIRSKIQAQRHPQTVGSSS